MERHVAGTPGQVDLLLVDDEPKNLTALEAILDGEGRNLVCAASGFEALRHALDREFAVIVLDVHMPEMDGFETAELIRQRESSRDTPIIFLTAAHPGEGAVYRGYSLGAVDYIVKPIDPHVLQAKVAAFAELYRQREQVRRQAEELTETTALLNSVLASVTDYAINGLDLAGRFVVWNDGSRKIYGYTAGEMVGRANVRDLHLPEDVASGLVDELFDTALRLGRAEGPFQRIRKDGRRFSAWLTVHRRDDANGTPVGFVSISRDITEQEQAERQRAELAQEREARAAAEAALRAREEFLAIAAHELKNPLATMSGVVQLLRRSHDTGRLTADRLEGLLGSLERASDRLVRLTNELLDVAQLQTGRLNLRHEPTDLTGVLEGLIGQQQATAAGHQLALEAGAAIGTVEADADRLLQVFDNLLSNALKYSPDGGEVRVSLRAEGEGLLVSVCDQGIGLPAGAAERIFAPFGRAENAAERNLPGLGLGLYLSRRIVEAHGGRIWAESAGEGLGMTVNVWLPAARAATAAHA